jgi:hypothetical protein
MPLLHQFELFLPLLLHLLHPQPFRLHRDFMPLYYRLKRLTCSLKCATRLLKATTSRLSFALSSRVFPYI